MSESITPIFPNGNETTQLNGYVYDASGRQIFYRNGVPVVDVAPLGTFQALIDRVSFEMLGTEASSPQIVENAIRQAIRLYERQRFYFNEFRANPFFYADPANGPGEGGAVTGADNWSSLPTGWGGSASGDVTQIIANFTARMPSLKASIQIEWKQPKDMAFTATMPALQPSIGFGQDLGMTFTARMPALNPSIFFGKIEGMEFTATMPTFKSAVAFGPYYPIAPSGSAIAGAQKFVLNPITISMAAKS